MSGSVRAYERQVPPGEGESIVKSSVWIVALLAGFIASERTASPSLAAAQSGQGAPATAQAAGARPSLPTFDTSKPVKLDITEATARYRVQEQLVGLNVLSDAVGTTSAVAGTLVIGPDGAIGRESRITVDLRTLKSDQEPRDNFIKTRTLEVDKFPMLELVPTRLEGLPIPLPSPPQVQALGFRLVGNVTLHGVTKEVGWNIVATLRGGTVAGRASATLLFGDFKITKPAVPVLLSVDDRIQVEVEFRASRTAL
jgi:polyisoprenoid-binding protein YceI